MKKDSPYELKWFHFLIYFFLFFVAISHLLNASHDLMFSILVPDAAATVYELNPGCRILDLCTGVLSLGMGVFALYVRFRLSAFRKDGPKAFYALLLGGVILSLLELSAVVILMRIDDHPMPFSMVSYDFINIVLALVLVLLNQKYFLRRKELFVN